MNPRASSLKYKDRMAYYDHYTVWQFWTLLIQPQDQRKQAPAFLGT